MSFYAYTHFYVIIWAPELYRSRVQRERPSNHVIKTYSVLSKIHGGGETVIKAY